MAKKEPVLLSGGNPQIAKGYGEEPIAAYIAAMPGVEKAVKWNSPFYGTERDSWFLSLHVYARYVRVTFFRGSALTPAPSGMSKYPDVRYYDIHEGEDYARQFAEWVRQASLLPGEKM